MKRPSLTKAQHVVSHLRRLAHRFLTPASGELNRFEGPFESWEAAERRCDGYQSEAILTRVLSSTLAVREGKAVAERDGVTFDSAQPPVGIVQQLQELARKSEFLRVLDFGGALGSTYFQCRPFLGSTNIEWTVVEQPHFAEVGIRQLQTRELRFSSDLKQALELGTYNVAVLSGVLQYLPDSIWPLAEIGRAGIARVVIDRTPAIEHPSDLIAIQRVAPEVYGAAVCYPIRVFSYSKLISAIEQYFARPMVQAASFDEPIKLGSGLVRFYMFSAAHL